MRTNEIKTTGTTYAFKPKGGYGKATQVRVIAAGVKRLVRPNGSWREQLSQMADGVLIEVVNEKDRIGGHNTTRDTRRKLSREEQKEHYPHATNLNHESLKYPELPNGQAIVRASEILNEWGVYSRERDEARERIAEENAARERAQQQRDAKLAQVQELLGVGELDVQYRSSSFNYTISQKALDAIIAKLS